MTVQITQARILRNFYRAEDDTSKKHIINRAEKRLKRGFRPVIFHLTKNSTCFKLIKNKNLLMSQKGGSGLFESDRNIYIQETDVKPNRYATVVLVVTFIGTLACWILAEVGIFRVGLREIRTSTAIDAVLVIGMLTVLRTNKRLYFMPNTKYWMVSIASCLTLSVTTFLTFHATIMLLFPMFVATLYRSKKVARIAFAASLFCTIFTPIIGYLLNTWDIELFKELILIGTNAKVELIGATDEKTVLSVLKILLYLSVPRTILVGACALLMFYVIGLSETHVNNQILLNKISRRDSVTGLFNQNYLGSLVENKDKDNYKQRNVGVIFFDVNDLKKINDSRGHEAGNLLLKRFGDSIKAVVDDEHAAGFRVGGDEFAILLLDADEKQVEDMIAEWEKSLEKINRQNREDDNGINVSAAHGESLGPMSKLDQLINQADEKMYRNKTSMKAKLNPSNG